MTTEQQRSVIFTLLIILIVLFITFSATVFVHTIFTPVTCSRFNTQKEAQEYFNKNHTPQLDRDKDGKACEILP